MKLRLLFLLWCISFLNIPQVNAQDYTPGTWITSEGDSVLGLIQNKIHGDRFISLKPDAQTKPEKYSADQIQKVYQNGLMTVFSYTLLKRGKRENIFFELISGGKEIGLYEGHDETRGKLYAVRKNKEITILIQQNLTSNYGYLYGDCSEISLSNSYVYTEKFITKEFDNYLTCKGLSNNKEDNVRIPAKTALLIGPMIGCALGNISFPEGAYYSRGTYSGIASLKIGLVAQYFISEKFSFGTQISYLNKTTTSDSVNTPPTYEPEVYSTLVEFDFDVLDWQLYALYGFLNRDNFSLNAGVGLNLGFILNSNFEQEANGYWIQDNGPPTLNFEKSREVGFLVSLGGVYYTKNKNQIQLNLKYNMTTMGYDLYRDSVVIGGIGAGSTSLQTSMMEISVNYLYKLSK